MQPWINYHHLNYFRVIAVEGSVSKAAKKLGVGQSTLSTQLKVFEETIGTPLFERRAKRLHLTERGRIALTYANEIFRLGGEMLEVLHDVRRPDKVHVQIGALDSVPKHAVLELVRKAKKDFDCVISLREGREDDLIREMLSHKLDLVISNDVPVSAGGRIFSRSLAKVPILVCGVPSFRPLKRGFPESLNRQPFILPSGSGKLRGDIDQWFRLRNLHPELIAETQDTVVQKLLGAEGMGLVTLPHAAAQDLLKSGELIEIGRLTGVSEEIHLLSATRKIENPVSARLMKDFRLT